MKPIYSSRSFFALDAKQEELPTYDSNEYIDLETLNKEIDDLEVSYIKLSGYTACSLKLRQQEFVLFVDYEELLNEMKHLVLELNFQEIITTEDVSKIVTLLNRLKEASEKMFPLITLHKALL